MGVEVGFPAGVKELTAMVKRKPVVGELMTIFRDNSGFSELANRWALYLENSKSYTDWTMSIDGSRGRLFDIDEVLNQERMLLNEYGPRLSSHLIDFDFIRPSKKTTTVRSLDEGDGTVSFCYYG